MKILNAEQIRGADAYTISNEPISSVDLMERAATACSDKIAENLSEEQPVFIFCGTGNNGGDGLVIARLLKQKGHRVICFAVRFSESPSEDFKFNEQRLKEVDLLLHDLRESSDLPEIPAGTLIIDAIFGTGLTRPVEGIAAELITKINEAHADVVSIDMPSGLFPESNEDNDRKAIVRAAVTLSFEVPKLAFFLAENGPFVGRLELLPIGLHPNYMAMVPTDYQLLTEDAVAQMIRPRPKFSHKGTYGHALLMAGSYGKMGAAVLAARACLKTGVGLLTMHVPKCGLEILQTSVPEAMCVADEEEKYITSQYASGYSCVGVGPGVGTDKATANALKFAIQNSSSPLVLDADALNILSENKTWLSFLPKGSVLTPHPGEFARLVGRIGDEYERLQALRDHARKWKAYIILKGAHTAIAFPDGQVFFNQTGNPGMATGGSGDVLTGMITALIAQGYPSYQAAILGVWMHGLAGDLAVKDMEMEALTAGDLVNYIGKAWKQLKGLRRAE